MRMSQITLTVNGQAHTMELDPEVPLLWALRDHVGVRGPKFGCGKGVCGACTVHVDGSAIRSCVTPVASVAGSRITTIEGLSPDGSHPLQRAWLQENVTQCGYCQPGQIMTAAAFLARNPQPTDSDIVTAMAGTLCRCGTYPRIIKAIRRAVAEGGLS
jgi:isoquinoline 1-oxidoreductase alpha subunit